MRKAVCVIFSVVALVGCGTAPTTGIVQISDDIFMYGKLDPGEWSGSIVKAGLYKEANAYCEKKGKKFTPVSSKSNDYIPNNGFASAEIQFSCK